VKTGYGLSGNDPHAMGLSPHPHAPQKHPRIYTRCPSCHCDTLTINNGRLLCTWHECKDPTMIDRMGELRLADFKAGMTEAAEIVMDAPSNCERNMCIDADLAKQAILSARDKKESL
jgi:hypothetical protein